MALVEQNIVSAVQAGQTANVRIDVGGPTHRAILIDYRETDSTLATDAECIADIERIEFIVDGETFWDLSAAELIMLNDYYGLPRVAGRLPLYFARPEFFSVAEEDNLAFGTLGVRAARLEVTLASGATAPELKVYTNPALGVPAQRMGQMLRVTSRPLEDVAGATENTYTNLVDPEVGKVLKALHFNTEDISDYKFEIRNGGSKAVYTEGDVGLHNLEAEMRSHKSGGYTAQTGYTHIQFAGDRHSRLLPTNVDELRATVTFSDAKSGLEVLREEIVGRTLATAA